MKICILVIYNDGEDYREMLKIQRSYLHKYDNVQSYFTMFRENQLNPIEIKGDFIYVKGKESYLGILQKTVDAFEYIIKDIGNFDYFIRTNMSTIVNIPALQDFCQTLPNKHVYTSGIMVNLQWLDEPFGITDDSLWGTKYASGTSIIMSKDVVKHIVDNKRLLRYDVVDDVAIGVYMTKYLPIVYTYDKMASFYSVPENIILEQIDNKTVFFRNRSSNNRKKDIKHMQIISSELYSSFNQYYGIGIGIMLVGYLVIHSYYTDHSKHKK